MGILIYIFSLIQLRGVIYIVSEVIPEIVVVISLFMIFLGGIYFLIGLIYHYIRNKTYLNVLIESIVIGFILGFFIRLDMLGFLEWIFFCFLAVFAGGVLAINLRKYQNSKSSSKNKKEYKMDSNYKMAKIDKSLSLTEEGLDESKKSSKAIKPRQKRFKDTIPNTPVQDVKIFNFNTKKDFTFKKVSVTADPHLSEDDAITEINNKLKEKASELGGNAVTKVTYKKRFLNLFGEIQGSGSVVYIKDLDNVERIYPSPWASFSLGGLWIFLGLMYVLDNDVRYYGYFWVGIFFIFNGFFIWRGYKNKTYFLGLVFFSGLLCAGVMYYLLNNVIDFYSYFGIVMFIILIIAIFYEYYQKDKNPEIPWKDEWGF